MPVSKIEFEEIKNKLFSHVAEFNMSRLQSELKSLSIEVLKRLTDMRDKEGNTLLTRATYENSFRITDCLITIYKKRLTQ